MYSKLIDTLTEEQKEQGMVSRVMLTVEKFRQEHIHNELDQLNFGTDWITRFLIANDFNSDQAAEQFMQMQQWRVENHVNVILVCGHTYNML